MLMRKLFYTIESYAWQSDKHCYNQSLESSGFCWLKMTKPTKIDKSRADIWMLPSDTFYFMWKVLKCVCDALNRWCNAKRVLLCFALSNPPCMTSVGLFLFTFVNWCSLHVWDANFSGCAFCTCIYKRDASLLTGVNHGKIELTKGHIWEVWIF